MTVPKRRRAKAPDSTKRSAAHLGRLADGGGKPIRVDTSGEDLKLIDELIAEGYADNMAETYRKSMREAHGRIVKLKPRAKQKN